MNLFDNLIEKHNQYALLELTDVQEAKLIGTPSAGKRIKIGWKENDRYRIEDEGYLFLLPGQDGDSYDYFVHIPLPDNSGGIDDAPSEWQHLNELLCNNNIEAIYVNQ